jgi:RNA polymerase sigma-70 factor (ECF subfamily)
MTTTEQVEKIFREEHGRVLAALISQFEDFDLAEDALQDALVNALERWEVDGIPSNPGAWLTTVARRRAIDRIRRATTLERSLVTLDPPVSQEEPEMDEALIPDDRLKLMFTCCHPPLLPGAFFPPGGTERSDPLGGG